MTNPKLADSLKRRVARNRREPKVDVTFLEGEDLDEVKDAVRDYVAIRSRLKRLGVLRSNRELQGEFAEWFAAKLLGLRLLPPFHRGHDAVDPVSGARYEIKCQQVPNLSGGTTFSFERDLGDFDWFLAVLLSPKMEPWAVVRIPRSHVDAYATTSDKHRHFRWTEEHFRKRGVKAIWLEDSALAGGRPPTNARQRGNKGSRSRR
jgi:hypothetical protein